jgi:hypothetical protein
MDPNKLKTKQDVFDAVAAFLLDPNTKRRSLFYTDDTAVCAYRGKDGGKCAVGYLIPDEVYTPDMEIKSVSSLVQDHGDVLPKCITDHWPLLASLQSVHDDASNWMYAKRDMKLRLIGVAAMHSLDAGIIQRIGNSND